MQYQALTEMREGCGPKGRRPTPLSAAAAGSPSPVAASATCPYKPQIRLRFRSPACVPAIAAPSFAPPGRVDQGDAVVVAIDTVEVLEGGLPRRQQRLVEAWAELHQDELLVDWRLLQSGQPPLPVEPLH